MHSARMLTVTPSSSYLKMNSLLRLYLAHFPELVQSVVHKYGQTYLVHHRTQVDELCRWTSNTQDKYDVKGPEVFCRDRLSLFAILIVYHSQFTCSLPSQAA